jgi:hypothetical protein
MCYYFAHRYLKEVNMSLLKWAVAAGRWDLAAHTIVLAAANHVNKGVKSNVGRSKKQNRAAR